MMQLLVGLLVTLAALNSPQGPPETDLARARALAKEGRLLQAANLLETLLKKDPSNARAHNDLGIVYWKLGRPSEAVLHLKLATNHDPNLVEPFLNLGLITLKQGQYETALDAYRRAARLKPEEPDVHFGMGLAAVYLKKLGQAREAMERLTTMGDRRSSILQEEILRAQGKTLPPAPP
jgi:Flp pilus assembly protein TadD